MLGVGGMGVVIAAHHMQLGQSVALKFLLPAGLANKQVVARFEREAKAAAQLRSEHVARVIDVGTLDNGGGPYIVMELLRGKDLADVLHENGPLAESDAVDYLLQACEAVAEAHNLGIDQRDLKPKNLFVTQRVDGMPLVKVLDFGISKLAGADDLSLTSTTEIIGSPNYMSPEQLKASRDVDIRSDIWSIGAILYELLGGRVPFVAETLTQLCSMVLTEPPRPLEELRPEVHQELRRVIARCLEKDPAGRFPNVGELAMALAPFASPAGSLLASRVAVVAGSSSGRLPPPGLSSGRIAMPGQSTTVSWDATELARTGAPGPKRIVFAGALVGALVVGGITTAFLAGSSSKTGRGSTTANAAAADPGPPAAQVSAAPTPAPSPPPAASSTPAPPVAPVASSAPTTAQAAPATKSRPVRQPRPQGKQGAAGGDEPPSDRK